MMSSPESKKSKETASPVMSAGDEMDNLVTPVAKKLKNDDVPEDTWTKYSNTYRLSKKGLGMTLLE